MIGFRNFALGLSMGLYFMAGHKLGIADPKVPAAGHFIEARACEVRGDGEVGDAIVERAVIGKWLKYEYEG